MPVPPGHYPRNFDLTGDFLRQNFVSLGAPGSPPLAPTGLTAQGLDGQVLLSWDSATGATSYVVKRSVAPGGPYVVVANRVTSVVYRDVTVINGTTYYYVVSSVNSAGASDESSEASATPVGIPEAPIWESIVPSSVPVTGVYEVRMSWAPSVGADTYNVYRSVNPAPGTWAMIHSGTGTAYLDDLSSGPHEILNYRLTAVSGAGESLFSNTEVVSAYGALGSIELTAQQSGNSALLSWSRPYGLPTNVQVNQTSGTFGDLRAGSWKTSETRALQNGTNTFSVQASNPIGNSPWSNDAKVVYAPGAGSLNVYPTGIATSQAFGMAVVSVASLGSLNVFPTGISTSQSFGTAVVTVGGTLPLTMPTYEQYLLANSGSNVQGYWPLSSGGSEYIYQRNGTLVGTPPAFGQAGIVNTNMKAAAMSTGGYRMEARPASPVVFGASNWTLIVWAKRDGLGTVVNSGSLGYNNFEVLIAKGMAEAESPANLNCNYIMGVREISGGDPRIAQDYEEAAGGSGPLGLNHPVTGNQTVPTGWNMIATTYDGTRHALYLNGVAQTAADGVINPAQPAESTCIAPFCVGGAMRSDQDTWYGRWNGTMQHAAMWSRVMSPNEIAAFYRVGAGLLAPSVELYSGSGTQPVTAFMVQVYPGTQTNGNADTVDDSSFNTSNVTVTRDSTLLTQGVNYTANFIGSIDRIAIYSAGSTFATGNYSIVVSGMKNTTQGYTMFPGTVSTSVTVAGTTPPPPITASVTFGSMFVSSPEYRTVRGYWPMGDGNSLQTVTDLAVVRNTGTFGAAQTWAGTSLYDGQYASSPAFTAATDAIRLDNIWAYGTWAGTEVAPNIAKKYRQKDFTVLCWFKRNTGPAGATVSTGSGGVTAGYPLVTKGMAMAEELGLNVNYFLGIDAGNHVVCDIEQADTGTNRPIFGTNVCAQDQWHLAVMSFDGERMTLYADGTIQGNQHPTDLADHFSQSRLTVGAAVTALNAAGTGSPAPDTPSGWFPGNITHVAVMAHPVDEHFTRRAYDAGRGNYIEYPSGTLVSPARFPAQGSVFVVRFAASISAVDDATVVPGEFQLFYKGYSTGSSILNQGTWRYNALGSGTHYAMSYDTTNDQATFTVLPAFGAAWPSGDYRLIIS